MTEYNRKNISGRNVLPPPGMVEFPFGMARSLVRGHGVSCRSSIEALAVWDGLQKSGHVVEPIVRRLLIEMALKKNKKPNNLNSKLLSRLQPSALQPFISKPRLGLDVNKDAPFLQLQNRHQGYEFVEILWNGICKIQ